jgi:iron complex transport system ATP-binding protein
MVHFLKATGFGFSFESRSLFQNVDFTLAPGELTALIGPNGVGKTTFLKALSGMPLPKGQLGGFVQVGARVLSEVSSKERARQVVYLGSEVKTEFPLKAFEVVQLGQMASGSDSDRVEESMKAAFCWELREREFSALSGGEKQLVMVARALAQASPFLLFDEAFSKLDLHHLTLLGQLLRKQKRDHGIVFISHDINYALEVADQVYVMEPKGFHKGLTQELLDRVFPQAEAKLGVNPTTGAPHVFLNVSSVRPVKLSSAENHPS